MQNTELPLDLETQVCFMKKYISFRQKNKMRKNSRKQQVAFFLKHFSV